MSEYDPQPLFAPLEDACKRAPCSRCGRECRVATKTNLTARPIRLANIGGTCANCALTEFLNGEVVDISALLPPGALVKEALRLGHVQRSILRVMAVGQTGLKPEEVDWELVIRNWDLPI